VDAPPPRDIEAIVGRVADWSTKFRPETLETCQHSKAKVLVNTYMSDTAPELGKVSVDDRSIR